MVLGRFGGKSRSVLLLFSLVVLPADRDTNRVCEPVLPGVSSFGAQVEVWCTRFAFIYVWPSLYARWWLLAPWQC